MKISGLTRFALTSCVAAAIVAGCSAGNGTPPATPPAGSTVKQARPAVTYDLLYSFKLQHGRTPYASLVNVNGTLYGTTYSGGTGRLRRGTVFAIATSGAQTVLHSFAGGSRDGAKPYAGLLNVNGTLYGTTSSGGAHNSGTVFAITTAGAETVLHSFGAPGDGAAPHAGLIDVNGTLYGTTYVGGTKKFGTVFAIAPSSGAETVLYSFAAGSGDGAYPAAGLLNVNGTLYGTTHTYGASDCGTVFAITTAGAETTLYNFACEPDGSHPQDALINVNGTLYGTTLYGGTNDEGTLFSITPSGTETVLHSFGGLGDAATPYAGLTNVNGTLYGTSLYGGGISCSSGGGCGTVYSITTSGKDTVLHSFGTKGDGSTPYAGLVNVNGTLYGTTLSGGEHCCGTVFSITP
jgi:uncharacterized repeat protein (TIGR03803 family)